LEGTALLQCAATFALNLALAWMVGVLSARWWLRRRLADYGTFGAPGTPDAAGIGEAWHAIAAGRLRGSLRWAAPLCLGGAVAALWAAAAAMAGVPWQEAADAFRLLLTQSAFGKAGLVGLLSLAVLSLLSWLAPRWRGLDGVAALLLLAFAASRVANSHAAEQGLFSPGMAVEYVHLLLVAQWVGSVAAAGWVVLPLAATRSAAPGSLARYLSPLSDTAAAALAGILATGIYNAWHALDLASNTAAQAFGSAYGKALIVKLVLVGLAAALGGYNKLAGFPAAARGSKAYATTVLRLESVLLAAALAAAAVLVSQQPPAAG
jgi:putative copper export protein